MIIVYILQHNITSDIYLYVCHDYIFNYNNDNHFYKTLILQNLILLIYSQFRLF